MSIFKDIIHLWRAEDLLSRAWEESYEMLNLSREMFVQAIKKLSKHDNIQTLKALKKRDKEINSFHRDVRRKVVSHFSLKQDNLDFSNGFVLISMVVDIERIGDYSKNILDLAINYKDPFLPKELSESLYEVEQEVKNRFDKTLEAIHTQDHEVAKSLLDGYKENVTHASDKIVNDIISGKLTFESGAQTAAIALYARYLKRIGGHLKNITTTIVNPIDTIGYMQ